MNALSYGLLSNPSLSLRLLLMRRGNHGELLLQYFHYLGQGFHCILFLESISSNIEGGWYHLNYVIIFEDFMSYPIYGAL